MKIYSTTIQEIKRKEDNSGFTVKVLNCSVKPSKNCVSVSIENDNFDLENFNIRSLDIGTAFKYMLDGFRIKRKHWVDSWIILIDDATGVVIENYGEFNLEKNIGFKKPNSPNIELNWKPTTEDLLSQDWELFKKETVETQTQGVSNENS